MHELAATQSILSLALDEAAKAGAASITKVSLRVGEWSTIEPDCVRFCFDVLAKGTPAEGAELAVELVPVRYECEACGLHYTPADGGFSCPGCSGRRGKLVSGRELYVDSIEVRHAHTARSKSSRGK